MANFHDLTLDMDANADFAEFDPDQDPRAGEGPGPRREAVPTQDLPFGSRRTPMETTYYDVFNQPNVQLVDVKETPIERVTATGIRTTDAEYDLDIIIFATRFDSISRVPTRAWTSAAKAVRRSKRRGAMALGRPTG